MSSPNPPRNAPSSEKLLGGLSFVGRTFEGAGRFEDSPYVLDMDANLYIGHADGVSRDRHAAVEVIYQFLRQTGRIEASVRELLSDRGALLAAFAAFDEARTESEEAEFRIVLLGTYDGAPIGAGEDDELPAGPCGCSVNEIKRRFYELCRRLDPAFEERELDERLRQAEERFR